jgi:hypothetical protein
MLLQSVGGGRLRASQRLEALSHSSTQITLYPRARVQREAAGASATATSTPAALASRSKAQPRLRLERGNRIGSGPGPGLGGTRRQDARDLLAARSHNELLPTLCSCRKRRSWRVALTELDQRIDEQPRDETEGDECPSTRNTRSRRCLGRHRLASRQHRHLRRTHEENNRCC